jgi:alpha-D-ribose 1-methylphosphonate 5-triphosphate synthase subunit PhnL
MPWAIFEDKPDTQAIMELISSKSGRIAAIVGGALLDEHLRETLLERLRESDVAKWFLRIDGPLGNLRPKIDLLLSP